MATTLAPAINFTNVSKGMKSLNTGVGNLKNSSDSIKTVTLNRTKIKRESFARDKILTNMREEAVKRKDQESIIEASGIGGAMRRSTSVIADSTKGFLGRILDFASSLLIGWLLYNLPTIMTAIENLITRITSLTQLLRDFISNITNTFENFGSLLSGVYQNVTQFDFTDKSKRVQSAMDDLNVNLETMRDQFMQGFDILSKPLGEGPGEKEVPPLNTDYTQDAPTTGGGDVSGYGTKEQQALLKTIRFAEGTAGPTGYSMFFGDKYGKSKYGDLTKLSANEVEKLVTKFLNDPQSQYRGGKSSAVGAYQIIDITSKARSLGMDMNRKFDQNFQDEMALRLAALRGVTAEVLKKEGLSDSVIKKLSPEWASFPGNTYGQPTKRSQDLKSTYQSSLTSPTKLTQPTKASGNAMFGETGNVRNAPNWVHGHFQSNSGTASDVVNDTAPIVQGLLNSGITPELSGGQKFSKKMSMEEIKKLIKIGLSQHGHSGDGRSVDIFVPKGTKVPFPIYDVRNTGGRGGVTAILPGTGKVWVGHLDPKSKSGGTKPTEPSSLAQVSPTTQPGQNVPSVAQDRRGQQIIIADNPQQPQSQQVSAGGGSQPQMIPVESSLNSLIKNQILLELAYT
jgi:muramidase (phage lysozyme)